MPDMVCLDTGFLIWGVQGISRTSQADMPLRAAVMIGLLSQQGVMLGVPTIVLAEYLVGINQTDHAGVISSLEGFYQLLPFDLACSRQFGSIARSQRALVSELAQQSDVPIRQKLRVDLFIIATALGHGATALYSEDRHMGRLAEGLIDVRAMPPLPDLPSAEA